MKLTILGGGQVNLSKRDFIGSGGEGQVYVRGSTAYKIYTNPKRMIPASKIRELSGISNPNVICPKDVLQDKKGPVGYTMRFVDGAVSICQLFTKAYKKRNAIGSDTILHIVQAMQSDLDGIHSADVLVVDLNEMNLLVKDSEVFWIDVDSYQTPGYPATAIMDSIRDGHANGKWSRETDWFSWGVVTFQLFMGIHPFKGKHPSVSNLPDRMIQNLSVFNKDVRVPKMVPSFDTIPEAYRSWYRAVFEDGKRVHPPEDLQAVVIIAAPREISSTDQISIKEMMAFELDVRLYEHLNGLDLVAMDGGIACLTNGRGNTTHCSNGGPHFGCTVDGEPIYGRFGRGAALFVNPKTVHLVAKNMDCQSMMSYDGRFYVHVDDKIMELIPKRMGGKDAKFPITMLSHPVANVMPRATKLFDGVAIQNMLGTWYASIFPESRKSHQVRLLELDGYQIADAKYDGGVMMIIGTKKGRYNKFVYRFERGYDRLTLFWKDEDVTYSGINFVTLDKGICAHIDESEDLVLFGASTSADAIKRISDPVLGGDMRLFKRGNDVFFARGKQLFKLSTSK